MFNRIVLEASKIARYSKKRTLDSREIQTAVRLIIPGELGKWSVSYGVKALNFKEQVKLY